MLGLTNCPELAQQLSPHAKDHIHGGLGKEVFLTKRSFPAIAASFLPCLKTSRTPRRSGLNKLEMAANIITIITYTAGRVEKYRSLLSFVSDCMVTQTQVLQISEAKLFRILKHVQFMQLCICNKQNQKRNQCQL